MLTTRPKIGIFSNQADIAKINRPTWPILELIWAVITNLLILKFWLDFELIRDFIHLICKIQENLIKTEWVMMMTKSNRGFFSNQGDVTLKLMIQPGQFSNTLRFHPCSPYLQVSGRPDLNWRSYADDKHFPIVILWDFVVVKQNVTEGQTDRWLTIILWPVYNTPRDFVHVHLLFKCQRMIKAKGVMLMIRWLEVYPCPLHLQEYPIKTEGPIPLRSF